MLNDAKLSPDQFSNYTFFLATIYLEELEKDTISREAYVDFPSRLRRWLQFIVPAWLEKKGQPSVSIRSWDYALELFNEYRPADMAGAMEALVFWDDVDIWQRESADKLKAMMA